MKYEYIDKLQCFPLRHKDNFYTLNFNLCISIFYAYDIIVVSNK